MNKISLAFVVNLFLLGCFVDDKTFVDYFKESATHGDNMEYKEAIAVLQEGIDVLSSPKEKAILSTELGALYFSIGMNNESENAYNQAVKIMPNYHAAHFGLGALYYSQGKHDIAIEYFELAITFCRNYAMAFEALAEIFRKKKEYKIANLLDKKALSIPFNQSCAMRIIRENQGLE